MTFPRSSDADAPTDDQPADPNVALRRPIPRVAPAEPLPVTIYNPQKLAAAPAATRDGTANIGQPADLPEATTPALPAAIVIPAVETRAEKPAKSKRPPERTQRPVRLKKDAVTATPPTAPIPAAAPTVAPGSPAGPAEAGLQADLQELVDLGNEANDAPAWVQPISWAAGGTAVAIILAGLMFLGPSTNHVVEVGSPFGPEDPAPVFAVEDSVEEAGLEAPASLGFVGDAEFEDGLVEDGLAEDGLGEDELESDAEPGATNEDDAFPADDELIAEDQPAEDQPADAAVAEPDPGETQAGGDIFLHDTFDEISEKWTPLAGDWVGSSGTYAQQAGDEFDQISQLEVDLPERYRVSVTMQPLDGVIGGGMILGQQTSGDRSGAHVLEITDDGTFLAWGVYTEDGSYAYLAGIDTPEGFSVDSSHVLTAFVEENATVVALDGEVVAEFDPVPSGRMGLVTSEAATAFDDLIIEAR